MKDVVAQISTLINSATNAAGNIRSPRSLLAFIITIVFVSVLYYKPNSEFIYLIPLGVLLTVCTLAVAHLRGKKPNAQDNIRNALIVGLVATVLIFLCDYGLRYAQIDSLNIQSQQSLRKVLNLLPSGPLQSELEETIAASAHSPPVEREKALAYVDAKVALQLNNINEAKSILACHEDDPAFQFLRAECLARDGISGWNAIIAPLDVNMESLSLSDQHSFAYLLIIAVDAADRNKTLTLPQLRRAEHALEALHSRLALNHTLSSLNIDLINWRMQLRIIRKQSPDLISVLEAEYKQLSAYVDTLERKQVFDNNRAKKTRANYLRNLSDYCVKTGNLERALVFSSKAASIFDRESIEDLPFPKYKGMLLDIYEIYWQHALCLYANSQCGSAKQFIERHLSGFPVPIVLDRENKRDVLWLSCTARDAEYESSNLTLHDQFLYIRLFERYRHYDVIRESDDFNDLLRLYSDLEKMHFSQDTVKSGKKMHHFADIGGGEIK